MNTKYKRLLGIFIFVFIILLIPLTAMLFTNDVSWDLNDFVVAGILLLVTGFTLELILRKVKTKRNRLLLSTFVLILLLLIWLELAVGIFGTPLAGT
ncbi:MAG: hypothetical protein KDD05_04360 [Psychroserpens sp.]|nr:hypothetical protein [Psychroserpens sp.]